jgi:tetratricopeptide (TPR) repeat protein
MPGPMSAAADQARVAVIEKGFAGSRPLIAGLCDENPEDQTLHAFHALVLAWTGGRDLAWKLLDSRMAPAESASILAVAAELRAIEDRKEESHKLLERAARIDPDDYFVLRTSHSLAGISKDYELAWELQARWEKLYPEDADIYGSQVTLYQTQGKLDALQRFLDESPEWFRQTAQYHAARGRLAFSRHNLPEMESHFQMAVAQSPESGSYWGYLAESQIHQGKLAEAERSAQFAVELNPNNPLALRVLSKVYRARGDSTKSAEMERKAADAFPAIKSGTRTSRATEFLNRGDLDGALKVYRQQAQDDNAVSASAARRIMLNLLVSHDRWRKAREQLNEIDGLGEQHPAVEVLRAQVLYHEGEKEEALQKMRILAQEPTPQPEMFPAALKMFLDAGAEEDTAGLVERLRTEPPGNPSSIAVSIIALDNAGRNEEARSVLQAAQRRYPDSSSLKVIEAGMASADGDGRRAFRIISQLPPGQRARIRIRFTTLVKVLFRVMFRRRKRE